MKKSQERIDKRSSVLKIVVICLLSLVIILAFGLLLMISYFIIKKFPKPEEEEKNGLLKEEEEEKNYQYQYYRYDPKTKESWKGIVSSIDRFDDQIYFKDQKKNHHILISNFGEKQFECHGKCYCGDQRRTVVASTSLISRSLSCLVAGATSFIVMKRAKEYFDSECRNRLSEECETSKIRTELDRCEGVLIKGEKENYYDVDDDPDDDPADLDLKEWEKPDVFKVKEEKFNPEKRNFVCKGLCRANTFTDEELKKLNEILDEEKTDVQGIDVMETCVNVGLESMVNIETHMNDLRGEENIARVRFASEFLRDLCFERGSFREFGELMGYPEFKKSFCTEDFESVKCEYTEKDVEL